MKLEKFMPQQEVAEIKTEQEKRTEQKELLELDREKLVNQERTLLSRFRGKARNIAKVLTLVTALTITPEFIRAAEAEQREALKIEQVEPEKAIEKQFYTLKFHEDIKAPPEIIENIELVYFYVVNDGEVKPIILSQEELNKSPFLDIDGYISSILIFCKDETDVRLNDKRPKKIQRYEHDNYISLNGSAVYPEKLKTKEYGEEVFQKLLSGEVVEGEEGFNFLKGGYFFGEDAGSPFYVGSAVNNLENNKLVFTLSGKTYNLDIKQKAFQKFKEINLDSKRSRDDIVFQYRGNAPDEFLKIEQLDERLQAIGRGANNVEDISDINLIDRVHLIDYNIDQAIADREEKFISFFSGNLKKDSPEGVRIATEHEVLHKYVFEKGLTESLEVREIFADLKGYTGKEREQIIRSGWIPFDDFEAEYTNKVFFSFIDEDKFFGQGGGHSHGNIWEFCTSFTHTLMEIERLEENLDKPIHREELGTEKELKLSREEKVTILDNYITVLGVMIQNVKDIPVIGRFYDNPDEKYLKHKLEHVKEVKAKYEQQS